MKWTDLPSLNALKAFAALAETGSYSRAGAVLNVTHAAVVQQVKALEERLGATLAVRSGRGVELTNEGKILAREVGAGFAALRRGVEALAETSTHQPVQITTSPVFAMKWLMPRISDFQTKHPDITLMLNPTGRNMDLRPGGIDLALRYGSRDRVTADVNVLVRVYLVIVGTPSLIGERAITDPAELLHLPWLQELGTNEVADWLMRHGAPIDRPLTILHMPGNLIMEAVRRGDGITYTARQWVESEIRSGELVELFPEEDFGFFYIHTRPGAQRRSVRTFIRWLKQQAADGV
jgi:LysR family glycine cleavage system transcriptional activator